MSAFWISFIVSASVTWCVLRHLNKKRAAFREQADKDAVEAAARFSHTMQQIVRQRIQHSIMMAQLEYQLEYAKREAERTTADEAVRRARAEGAIDSTCFEVPARRKLH